jgi:anti-sigma regulatory factor (Ser/Thr protein kinase)
VLTDAESTHPILVFGGHRSFSARYTDPRVMVAAFNQPLPEPTSPTVAVTFQGDGLGHVRDVVADRAAAAGLSADRVLALQLAVNELAANTVAHTAGPGTLRVWQDHEGLVCEIKDSGTLTDALAGRRGQREDDSRGLLLVHCLCDLVEVHTEDSATTIRLRMTA